MHWLFLLAQQGQDGGGQQPQMSPFGNPMLLFLLMGIMVIFMIWLPNRKQRQERAAMFARLKKNDKVVTMSGIIGVVVAIKDNEDEVTLKVDDTSNTRIRVLKSSINQILTPAEEPKEEVKTG
jgi:preprotein translocase subunit YajC